MAKKKSDAQLQKFVQNIESIANPSEKKGLKAISFEKILSHLNPTQQKMLSDIANVNLFLAGQGAGKTHTLACIAVYFISNFPNIDIFIGANTDVQLAHSTLSRTYEVWQSLFGWKEYNPSTGEGDFVVEVFPPAKWTDKIYKTAEGTMTFSNGSTVYLGSLTNAKAHDGKQFAVLLLDETKDTKHDDVTDVMLGRVRQKGLYIDKNGKITDKKTPENVGFNASWFFTSPAKVQWLNDYFGLTEQEDYIKTKIYDKKNSIEIAFENKKTIICSAYHNEENLGEGFIQNQFRNMSADKADMLIYGNPFAKSGGEFYSSFSNDNIGEAKYNPLLPIHVSFDFNVNPGIHLTIYQVNENRILQIDEIKMVSPKNTTEYACIEFCEKYDKHEEAVFVYGDVTSKKQNTITGKYNDFSVIKKIIGGKFKMYERLPKVNPEIADRRVFVNKILRGNFEVQLIIGQQCTVSIADLRYTKEDVNGKKAKTVAKNPITGIKEQIWGHTSDTLDYFLCEIFKYLMTEYTGKKRLIKGGKSNKNKRR